MLEIIICDDDQKVVDWLLRFTEAYLIKSEQVDVYVKLSTTDPEEVLDLVRAGNSRHQAGEGFKNRLFLLDIEFGDAVTYDGIALGSKIRQYDQISDIVFITSARGLVSDAVAHNIAPLSYLAKHVEMDTLQEQVHKIIDLARSKMISRGAKTHLIEVDCGRKSMYVDLSQILYIKGNSANHDEDSAPDIEYPMSSSAFLRTSEGDYDLKKTLGFYDKEIPELIRLGRSYLINPLAVREIHLSGKKGTLILTNQEEITAMRTSVVKYKETVKALRGQ